MKYGSDDSSDSTLRKLGHDSHYSSKQHVAEDLVEGGTCSSYDEAYEVLNSMRNGDMVKTYRGTFKKE